MIDLTRPRLAFFYGAFFAAVGVLGPFWPVWLASRGLAAEEIGLVMAVGVTLKVAVSPFLSQLADRRGERKRLMILFAAAALAAFLLFDFTIGFWSILAVSVLFHAFWTGILPLGESLTVTTAGQHGLEYGRLRLWGSLGFIASAVIAGRLLVGRPESLIHWLIAATVALTLVACLGLPGTAVPRASSRAPLGQLLRRRRFLVFLAAAALIQGSHSVYYGFSTLHWRGVGYSEAVIGGLWAEGVVAEIILFIYGATVARRLGAVRLVALGGIAAALRWTATGLSDALPVLMTVQALHALTYGATHLGAIYYIAERVAPEQSATAQGLYGATVFGIGMGLAMLVSGPLYGTYGGGAFLAMAVLALAGGLTALGLLRRD